MPTRASPAGIGSLPSRDQEPKGNSVPRQVLRSLVGFIVLAFIVFAAILARAVPVVARAGQAGPRASVRRRRVGAGFVPAMSWKGQFAISGKRTGAAVTRPHAPWR